MQQLTTNHRGYPPKKLFDFEIIDVSYAKFIAESDSAIRFELSFVLKSNYFIQSYHLYMFTNYICFTDAKPKKFKYMLFRFFSFLFTQNS